MLLDYIKHLYDYHYWANARVLRLVERLDADQEPGSGRLAYERIHATLVHMVGAEAIWRSRWQGVSPTRRLGPDDLPTLPAVQRRWQDEERQVRTFLGALQDEDLAAPLSYTTLSGQSETVPLAATLLHVSNHGTQHRSEVALLLSDVGYSPGDLDFHLYLRKHTARLDA